MMKNVKVGAVVDSPYAEECFVRYPSNCKLPGMDIQFIYTLLSEFLQMNVDLINYDTYEEADEALENEEIDLIGISYSYNKEVLGKWKYFTIFTEGQLGFIVKSVSSRRANSTQMFTIFSWQLWLMLLFVTITVCCIQKLAKYYNSGKIVSYGTATLVAGFWFVILNLIIEVYGNLITVNLVLPDTVKAPFDNLTDLGEKLNSQECKFAMLKKYLNSTEYSSVLFNPEHNRSWAHSYETAYNLNPPIWTKDRKEMIHHILNNSCVVGLDYVTDFQQAYYDKICGIHVEVYPEEIPVSRYMFYHKINDTKTISIIESILGNQAFAAYYQYLFKQHQVFDECDEKTAHMFSSIDLSNLQNTFLVLIAFLALTFLLFCFKTLYSHQNRNIWKETFKITMENEIRPFKWQNDY